MMLTRSAALIGVTALLLRLATAQGPCYYPGGDRSADVPCDAKTAASVCCASADACLPDGLCRLDDDDDAARDMIGYAHGTCTDPSWASDVCFPQNLLAQDSHSSRASSFVARRGPETTAAASPTGGSSGSSGGLGTGAKAGIGIGVALGIVALGAAGYFQRRARLKRRASGTADAGDEKSGQHGYEMDEATGNGHGGEKTPPVICEGGTCSRLRMVGA
ncbi:hypothetical protein CGRA01v4_06565 [Colletotrichum graminicola]|uniref:Uncharacterized protein n=1 Tax=Colletotrichum graminicola (strain M1.001 / M2 / FGSC 10212) TaxID=645133 RepID=E3Q207_COLGM|nr:uncharacterized protein GLRG_00252 [Colletotrichum graminicola M1.001]EFQ25108.1 hypothetical protein GLRG_00252 [Colletotrichum graminicola M1.001]WDK15284.1 hypothetical protein CGRA01v4_06565 [Colletotrichum graminicola]